MKGSKIKWHETSHDISIPQMSLDIAMNGLRILDTPKWRAVIKATVIHRCANGLGAIEWLDADNKALIVHQGELEEGKPGTPLYLPRIGKVEVIEYA